MTVSRARRWSRWSATAPGIRTSSATALFRDAHHLSDAAEAPPVMFAVSQSGETEPVLNDVRHARQNGHKIVTFTKRSDSTLAQMSDIVFVVDGSRQTLAGSLPNSFFGHVILAFEELVAFYFGRERDA